MPCPLAAPTYTKEKEKDRSAHTATKKPATTVTTFIINCKSEKRNDLHASRSEGNCKGASSRTKVSSPFTSRFKSSAAAKASATPNAYIASTNRTEPPKKLPASASQTGSFAEQEMKGRMRMTRRCTCLLSSPRVVRIAAAVQPKPNKSEKTALPVSPTRRNTPSVMNASADKKPLSSNKKSAKYRMASCGRKERCLQKVCRRRGSARRGEPRERAAQLFRDGGFDERLQHHARHVRPEREPEHRRQHEKEKGQRKAAAVYKPRKPPLLPRARLVNARKQRFRRLYGGPCRL